MKTKPSNIKLKYIVQVLIKMDDNLKLKLSHHFWVMVVILPLINSSAICFADDLDSVPEAKQAFDERPIGENGTANANGTQNIAEYETTAASIITPPTTENIIVIISHVPADEQIPDPNIADALKASRFHLPLSILAVLLSVSWPYKINYF